MWKQNPKIYCLNHILGCHNEFHKFKPDFVKKKNMDKRILKGQIEPKIMKKEHDRIVKEMKRRGYKHNTPYEIPDISYIDKRLLNMKIERNKALKILLKRCEICRARYKTLLLKDYKV